MSLRPDSVMALVDAIDNGHAGLQLQIQAAGHVHLYGAAVADLRLLVCSLRDMIDNRATGEFRRLERERDRRETPTDPEAQTPPRDTPRPMRPIVEQRRRPTRDDDDR